VASRAVKMYFFPGREPNISMCKCNWIQGYTNFGRLVRPGRPNLVQWRQIWTVLRVAMHVPRILKWLLDICKNYALLA